MKEPPPPKIFQKDVEKLKELILYVCQKLNDSRGFGLTKLNKILYFCDFLWYARTGKPVTGVDYVRLPHGPGPNGMEVILDELLDDDKLAIQDTAVIDYTAKKPVNLIHPNISEFDPEEVAFIDGVIDELKGATAKQLTDYTHDHGGWRFAKGKQRIPYESIFIIQEPLTPEIQEKGLEIAKKHGLLDDATV